MNEDTVLNEYLYLVRISLLVGKKAGTKKWNKVDPPRKDEWMDMDSTETLVLQIKLIRFNFIKKCDNWYQYVYT